LALLSFEYNDANKLVRVRLGDDSGPVIAEFFYDHSGRRIKKIENGVVTYYVGKHFDKVVKGDSPGETVYYFAGVRRVAKKDQDGNRTYFHTDHLESTSAATNSSGNVMEWTKHYPFGGIRKGGTERYEFTGKEKDSSTDYHYFESRHYNSGFKHFVKADIVNPELYNPQSLNRYAYVLNNPLKYTDRYGFSGQEINDGNLVVAYEDPPSLEDYQDRYMGEFKWLQDSAIIQRYNKRLRDEAHKFPPYREMNTTTYKDPETGEIKDRLWCTTYVAEHYQIKWDGNAGTWLKNAKNSGYATGDVPAKNSIVVTNEGGVGHVAIVDEIITNEHGEVVAIMISESNYPSKGERNTRTIRADSSIIKGYVYTQKSRFAVVEDNVEDRAYYEEYMERSNN
jgi:RHS repeat-associated protein